jgi:UDP-N-acetylmuramoylalanine--D-glutamate ligase
MNLKGRKVAIIGVGVEGLSTLRYLDKQGVKASIVDKKEEEEIDNKIISEVRSLGATISLGKNYLQSLDQFDVVFRSPSVRPDTPLLKEAAEKGTQITSQIKFFFDLCAAPIIGVTGTKGKGTTASLLYEILKAGGRKVFFCGNIGRPPLDVVGQVTKDSLVILELSSFQLFDLEKGPHIAVILMVTSEHLDWHKNVGEYIEAKKNITKYQNKSDLVVLNNDYEQSKLIGEFGKGEKYYFSTKEEVTKGAYLKDDKIVLAGVSSGGEIEVGSKKIPGEHNLQNILAAVLTSNLLGADYDTAAQTINNFKGLPHRLEFVGEENQVGYYNDSASTIPETAIAAIKAFKNPKIMILGGSSKNSDFSLLGREIVENDVKAVILIGQEAERIKKAIGDSGEFLGQIIQEPGSMKEIIDRAKGTAKPGDVVILSPACASFDMFKNYQDRGDQFKLAIDTLNKN